MATADNTVFVGSYAFPNWLMPTSQTPKTLAEIRHCRNKCNHKYNIMW